MKYPFLILILLNSFIFANQITAGKYCVLDGATKKIVKEKDSLKSHPPASTVKLLTAMVVIDKVAKLDQNFFVSSKAENIAPIKINLMYGEEMSCKDLLTALLVKSANDVAIVLAEGVSKSEKDFALLINEKANKIGCKNSFFTNPHGLPSTKQTSCAYDMALIALEASKYPLIKEILAIKKVEIKTSKGRIITLQNSNVLLNKTNPIYGKTGWTNKARNNFAGFAIISDKVVSVCEIGRASCRERV